MHSIIPELGAWLNFFTNESERLIWLVGVGLLLFAGWQSHWRNRYARRMKLTFELTNLYIKPKKDKLFPQLLSLTRHEDELFYVFRYRLRPGMSVTLVEEKKKMIEAAFHAETKVFGKGGIVTIKVKKKPYPVPMTEQGTQN